MRSGRSSWQSARLDPRGETRPISGDITNEEPATTGLDESLNVGHPILFRLDGGLNILVGLPKQIG